MSKAFRTPAKMDDESKAASEAKSDESMQGLEEEKGAPIESSRERLGRISEDPEGAQEPFLMGLDGTNKLEPGGTEWEDDLSETSSVDWKKGAALESTPNRNILLYSFFKGNLRGVPGRRV